ncbi:Sulfate transport system permease protein CysW [invertebrate metagenome]|uniref:Sulfate transport system permease protein CysW n=1 Tax=invertebrate metagenome TaxID=1711999 RepID=A0A2H9TCF6_9ZZZZ
MPLSEQLFPIVILTVKLAGFTTVILLIISMPMAWWMSNLKTGIKRHLRTLLEAGISLPMVLPPTVLGFYLLLAFSPQYWLGHSWLSLTGSTLAFSFPGLLVASVIYSLPFVVQPLQRAFEQVDRGMLEAAATMGSGAVDRFIHIVLPNTRRTLFLSACMGFAHTVGEFGVVLMIGGNIEGETRVLSIALFDAVESQRFDIAHAISAGLVVFSLIVLIILYSLSSLGKQEQPRC